MPEIKEIGGKAPTVEIERHDPKDWPTTYEEWELHFQKARSFDPSEIPVVRRAFAGYRRFPLLLEDETPEGKRPFLDVRIEELGGNPTSRAEAALIRRSALQTGRGLYAEEALRISLARFKAELLGPNPSAIERVLVDSIGCAWLDCMEAEERAAKATAGYIASLEFLERRKERATRRLHSGLKALDLVRRKAIPATAIQVNVSIPDPARDGALDSDARGSGSIGAEDNDGP